MTEEKEIKNNKNGDRSQNMGTGTPLRGEPVPVYPEYEEVHLIEYVNVLLKRRWMIILGVMICVIFTGVYSKMLPPVFTASAKFLPSKNPDMVSRMGMLVGAGGKIESFEDNVTSEYYTELLKSSLFMERIAGKKFISKKAGGEVDLVSYYEIEAGNETEKMTKATNAIGGSLKLSTDRNTKVVSISYSTHEPELSATIVNAFLEELIVYNQDIRDTKAKQNRLFIEKQVEETQTLLRKAEAELAEFTTRNKKIATPDLEMELDRLKRSVKIQEEVFLTLKKQLELAKIEEQERKPAIEIIEKAVPPLYKSKPRVKMNVILAGFVSLFMFVGLAFVLEWMGKMNPEEERNRQFLKYISDIKRDLMRLPKLFKK